jgi:hypothetical protein
MTLSIMAVLLCWLSLMWVSVTLSVTNKPYLLCRYAECRHAASRGAVGVRLIANVSFQIAKTSSLFGKSDYELSSPLIKQSITNYADNVSQSKKTDKVRPFCIYRASAYTGGQFILGASNFLRP